MNAPKPIDSSEIVHHNGGTTITGKDGMNFFAALQLRMAISLWIKTGMIPTRGVGITRLLAIAKEYTGKTYKRTEAQKALDDLEVWIQTMKAALPITDNRTKP